MLANDETLQLVYNVLDKKGYIDIPAFGSSMYPLIKKGDLCRFVPINEKSLKKGDILLFLNSSGQLIGHRFHDMMHSNEGPLFLFKGDAESEYSMPTHLNQLIGKLVIIQRQDRIFETSDLSLRIWKNAMLYLPFLSKPLKKLAERAYKKSKKDSPKPKIRRIK